MLEYPVFNYLIPMYVITVQANPVLGPLFIRSI